VLRRANDGKPTSVNSAVSMLLCQLRCSDCLTKTSFIRWAGYRRNRSDSVIRPDGPMGRAQFPTVSIKSNGKSSNSKPSAFSSPWSPPARRPRPRPRTHHPTACPCPRRHPTPVAAASLASQLLRGATRGSPSRAALSAPRRHPPRPRPASRRMRW
jgi:hypothetical protein